MPLNTLMPSDLRALAPAPGREDERQHAENEGEGRHQDRPEPEARGVDGGFENGLAVLDAALARDLDDQNAVLGRQRDQQHEADLRIEIIGDA